MDVSSLIAGLLTLLIAHGSFPWNYSETMREMGPQPKVVFVQLTPPPYLVSTVIRNQIKGLELDTST